MNLLSKSEVFAENKLFATLDTTVRKVVIENLPFLLTDTVGFIRKLPHQLIESFKSTLDEVRESDILVHVLDISHPNFEDHFNVVNETLAEIDKTDKPTILVFNKIDAYRYVPLEDDDIQEKKLENYSLDELKKQWMAKMNNTKVVFISAHEKLNIEEFKEVVYDEVRRIFQERYPYHNFLY
jgi:GTPase